MAIIISGDARNITLQLRQVFHVQTDLAQNYKALKLKLMCFLYMHTYKLYVKNDKIFCFIDLWGRHVQKIVKRMCVAGGGNCL